MRGFPPPPEKRPDLTNWDLPPFNRWSFMNIRNLFPTADVKASRKTRRKLPRAMQDLSAIDFIDQGGRRVSLPEFLYSTYTDGFLVLHKGEVISEAYFNNMQTDTAHLSQSVSKSIVGTLAGILSRCDPVACAQHDQWRQVCRGLRPSGFRYAARRYRLGLAPGSRR